MTGMQAVSWWPTMVVVATATVTDLRSKRIPNWLVLPFLGLGLLIAPFRPDAVFCPAGATGIFHWQGLVQSLEGLGLGLLVFGVMFVMGGMGAGDVKLVAAVGAWIGAKQLFVAMVLTGLAGGVMILCWAVYAGFMKDLLVGTVDLVLSWLGRSERPEEDRTIGNPLKRKIPYAPAIAVGTFLSFFAG